MAYRLSEVIHERYLPQVGTTSNVFTTYSSWRSGSLKTKRVCPIINTNKNIIFECSLYNIFNGLSSDLLNAHYEQSNEIVQLRFPEAYYVYCNKNAYKITGYSDTTLYKNRFVFFSKNYNNVDYFYHLVVNPTTGIMRYYNAITKAKSHEITFGGLKFENTLSFAFSSDSAFSGTLNPDVESFKYTPATTYDTDLYQAVLASPQGDIVVHKTKNILSIL